MNDRQRREARDADLRAFAVHAVRMYLEVAAGRRPPRTMTGLATPLAVAQLHDAAARARDTQRPGRIRRIAVHRAGRDQADVAALIADHDGLVTAVTIRLQQVGRRWQISDVHQLDRGHHHTHTPTPAGELTPAQQHAARWFDVAVLNGAATAAEHRARTAATPQQRAASVEIAAEWRGRARRAARTLGDSPDPPAPEPAPRPVTRDAHRVAMLGSRPDDAQSRERWDSAAKLLDGYRTRWNITDPANALGPVPPRGVQRDDRRRTLTRISGIVRELTALQRDRTPPQLPTLETGLDGP